MEKKIDALQSLEDSIYMTRKCRINSAERLKRWDTAIAWINTYYTAFLIVLSVIAISAPQEQTLNINIYIISSSVLALAFNTLSMTWQFKDRYYNFKENYIQLHALYLKILTLKNDPQLQKDQMAECQTKYNELLNACENHTSTDYYCVLRNDKYLYDKKIFRVKDADKNNPPQMEPLEFSFRYWGTKSLKPISLLLMIIAPFALPLLIQYLSLIVNA